MLSKLDSSTVLFEEVLQDDDDEVALNIASWTLPETAIVDEVEGKVLLMLFETDIFGNDNTLMDSILA